MSFSDRMMMRGLAAMLKKKKDKREADRELERAISGSYDISDRKYIGPVVAFLEGVGK